VELLITGAPQLCVCVRNPLWSLPWYTDKQREKAGSRHLAPVQQCDLCDGRQVGGNQRLEHHR
jgi:hypothetical protein